MAVILEEISKLSLDERIQLAQTIWEGVIADSAQIPLTDAQAEEIDRRLDDLDNNPQGGMSWEELKRRIQQHK